VQIPLEKIDQLRERAGIGYSEARNILEEVDGDLVEALIYIEERRGEARNRVSSWSRDISQQLRQFAAGLHRTRLRVKVKDNTLMELPASYGALGAALFPKIAALGLIGVLFSAGSIEIKGASGGGAAEDEQPDKENLDKKENPGLGSDQA
jgi:hypothetical protein